MAFDVIVKFYAKADDKVPAKHFLLPIFYRSIEEKMSFRSEFDGSYYDYYATPSRDELCAVISEYRLEYGNIYPVFGKVMEELESGASYGKYEIHLMEWESGMD